MQNSQQNACKILKMCLTFTQLFGRTITSLENLEQEQRTFLRQSLWKSDNFTLLQSKS